MTHTKDEALKLALDSLLTAHAQTCSVGRLKDWQQLSDAIKQALAAPTVQEIEAAYACGYSNGMTEGYEAGKAYAAMQKAIATPPAQPAPVPLTQQQVVDGFCKTPHQTQYVAVFDAGVRFAEAAHGITKGQP
jgi:hypothetical protein